MSRFDNSFTQKLREWLDDENRDYAEGAMLLFRLRGNHTEFRKLSANPQAYRQYIVSQIKKFYDFRSADISHEYVSERVEKAVSIAKAVKEEQSPPETRSGKRADHDSLPEEIRKCYADNLDLMRRISDRHTKIRLIIQSNASCKDADLLPFAEEIVKLDKKRLANWKKYDSYKTATV